MHWLFVLPLLSTLGACVVLVRALRALEAESRALIMSAERLAPVVAAIGNANVMRSVNRVTASTGAAA